MVKFKDVVQNFKTHYTQILLAVNHYEARFIDNNN